MLDEIDISRLSASECILLAEQLWEQARAHSQTLPLSPAHHAELDRRLDALDSGEMSPGEPWEIVRERLARR